MLIRIFTMMVLCMWTLSSSAQAVSEKLKARLAQGEIITSSKKVPGSDMPEATGLMVVNAPPQPIWRLLDRCGDYKRTMQRVTRSKEVWRKANVVRCEIVIDMPAPLDDLRAVTDATHTVVRGKKYVRAWKLVEGDFESNTGSWTLVPFDERGTKTLVIYKVHAVPNTSVPDVVKRLAQRKALPKALEHLRSHFKAR